MAPPASAVGSCAGTGATFAGGAGTTASPYQVATAAQLNSIRGDYLDCAFIQTADISLAAYTPWVPLGAQQGGLRAFTGTYDGNDFGIRQMAAQGAFGSTSYVGLFAYLSGGGAVSNLRISGSATGTSSVGGLAGVTGYTSSVANVHVNAVVTGTSSVGGLIGEAGFANITDSSTRGAVMGTTLWAGGLVGKSVNSNFEDVTSSAAVTGAGAVGGLIGELDYGQGYSVTVNRAVAWASVTASGTAGGLVGAVVDLGPLNGGPAATLTVTESYWSQSSTGQATSATGTSKTTAELKNISTYAGWGMATSWTAAGTAWALCSGGNSGFPFLQGAYGSDVCSPPGVTSIDPTTGPAAGDTPLTIYGSLFTGASAVSVGGANAAFTVVDDTTIVATAPAVSVGARDVVVTTDGGNGTLAGGYTSQTSVPGVPQSVSATGGNAQMVVSWTAPAIDAGAPVTAYEVSVRPINTSSWTVTTDSASASPVTVSGLVNGTTYEAQVRARNSVGWGSGTTSPGVLVYVPCPAGATEIAQGAAATCQEILTTSGTWSVPTGVSTVDVLVVGGGGAGSSTSSGGGGGGGQVRVATEVNVASAVSVTVGAGGSSATPTGGSTVFDPGVVDDSVVAVGGTQGASAGGSSRAPDGTLRSGGSAYSSMTSAGGGGAGSGAAGGNASGGFMGGATAGNGGAGVTPNTASGGVGLFAGASGVASTVYGGGGGGGGSSAGTGSNGGGTGGSSMSNCGTAGTDGRGGGGGGKGPGGIYGSCGTTAEGGDGVVILRYLARKADQAALTVVAATPALVGSTQTLSTSGGSTNGAVTFDVGASTGCSVAGSLLSINALGTCAVTATMAGDATYSPVTSSPTTVVIQSASPSPTPSSSSASPTPMPWPMPTPTASPTPTPSPTPSPTPTPTPTPSPTPTPAPESIVITPVRIGDVLRIRGVVEGAEAGTVVIPRIRVGRGPWRPAVTELIIGPGGTFTWTRPAPRAGRLSIMIVIGDVRSNVITIRARG